MIREKKTLSGDMLEVDFYPVYDSGRRVPARAPGTKPTTAAQAKYNRQKAIKRMIRLINTNFRAGDYIMSPTYCPDMAPATLEEARKDLVNYLRRVKRRRAAAVREIKAEIEESGNNALAKARLEAELEKLIAPMKYVYTIEEVKYKSGERAGRSNYHFHLFLTGGLQETELEEMWPHGMRTNVRRYQPERFGTEAAARYLCKDPRGQRRFACSKNMEKPVELPPEDGAVSKCDVEMLARQRVDDAAYWESRYSGYRFVRCFARYNEFNGNWYVSVIMYRKGAGTPPEWNIDDWLDD